MCVCACRFVLDELHSMNVFTLMHTKIEIYGRRLKSLSNDGALRVSEPPSNQEDSGCTQFEQIQMVQFRIVCHIPCSLLSVFGASSCLWCRNPIESSQSYVAQADFDHKPISYFRR